MNVGTMGKRPAVGIVVDVAARHAGEVDRAERFPVEAFTELRATGLLGLLVPAEFGGCDGDITDLTAVAQALGGACQATAMAWVMHSQQVDALVRFARPELRERLLPRVATGALHLGSVTTEPTTGGHLLSGDSALVPDGDGHLLARVAPVVTGGAHADGFLVKVRSAPDAPASDLSLVYVDRADVDIEVTGDWRAMGMRGVGNVALTLRGRVPPEHVVGGRGGFREIAVRSFAPVAHLGWASVWLGGARTAWARLLAHMRGAGGRVDLRSDLTKARIADIRLRVETVSAMLRVVLTEVTRLRETGGDLLAPATQIHLNALKVLAARECRAAVAAMVELAGLDTGYRSDSPVPLERLLRDLTSASLNYSDTRLTLANGAQSLLDPHVTLAGDHDPLDEKIGGATAL